MQNRVYSADDICSEFFIERKLLFALISVLPARWVKRINPDRNGNFGKIVRNAVTWVLANYGFKDIACTPNQKLIHAVWMRNWVKFDSEYTQGKYNETTLFTQLTSLRDELRQSYPRQMTPDFEARLFSAYSKSESYLKQADFTGDELSGEDNGQQRIILTDSEVEQTLDPIELADSTGNGPWKFSWDEATPADIRKICHRALCITNPLVNQGQLTSIQQNIYMWLLKTSLMGDSPFLFSTEDLMVHCRLSSSHVCRVLNWLNNNGMISGLKGRGPKRSCIVTDPDHINLSEVIYPKEKATKPEIAQPVFSPTEEPIYVTYEYQEEKPAAVQTVTSHPNLQSTMIISWTNILSFLISEFSEKDLNLSFLQQPMGFQKEERYIRYALGNYFGQNEVFTFGILKGDRYFVLDGRKRLRSITRFMSGVTTVDGLSFDQMKDKLPGIPSFLVKVMLFETETEIENFKQQLRWWE
jgi:hypothetical protein